MDERICSEPGCEEPHRARDRCKRHYQQWNRDWHRQHDDSLGGTRATLVKPGRSCTVEDCPHPHEGNGYCHSHNWRFKQHGDPQADKPIRGWRQQSCSIPGCEGRYYSNGWCTMHYGRWRAHGDPLKQVYASPGQADHYHQGYHQIHVNGRVMREHRHVMEQHLGRALLPGENVHHRDLDRANNAIGNLELWITKQPKGARAVDLLAWAEEIVARYGPERDKL